MVNLTRLFSPYFLDNRTLILCGYQATMGFKKGWVTSLPKGMNLGSSKS